jgi:molecular chaperone DnaK (HSP70)
MSPSELIVGIDLGTTNSEIAAWTGERIEVLGAGASRILPSCIGLSATGELLVGQAARNQQLVAPERTLSSIKRKMGTDTVLRLGDRELRPEEASALILRELARCAEQALGVVPRRAVITVPAYFSDAQRHATREAGELAGLEVVRILNEPTAASLAYGDAGEGRTLLVYDLGGGTFDVSIVRIEETVTEVLASHGDNALGGDDFDQLLADHLANAFAKEHGVDLRSGHPAAWARLRFAAEQAKRTLSFEPYATVREDHLATIDGRPRHLELELSREQYESMISPLIERTLASVHTALRSASIGASELDAVLLVGGSTRTPLVARLLEERTGRRPHSEVHPDLCVALGAGVLASRLSGLAVERVLVDVTPYSFGVSHLDDRDGEPYPHCYSPTIERNTALPVTRTRSYFTAMPYQEGVHIEVFQGDDPDALKNIPVGDFHIEGLTRMAEPNEVLCRMHLDLDGILQVSAIEKRTGKIAQITIERALRQRTPEEIAAARERLDALHATDSDEGDSFVAYEDEGDDVVVELSAGELADAAASPSAIPPQAAAHAKGLLERSRGLLDQMHDEDRQDAIDRHEAIEDAIAAGDNAALASAVSDLEELLFFVEGR